MRSAYKNRRDKSHNWHNHILDYNNMKHRHLRIFVEQPEGNC